MFSSNTIISPLPKRCKIDVPNQVASDEDTVVENEANRESDIDSDSELEFEDDTDLGEVEDIKPESTQEQTTMM